MQIVQNRDKMNTEFGLRIKTDGRLHCQHQLALQWVVEVIEGILKLSEQTHEEIEDQDEE